MYYGTGYGFYVLFHFLWLLVIVIVIVWIIRMLVGHGQHHFHDRFHNGMGTSNALEILKERYAKGEINKDEFEAKKKDLLS